VAQEQASILRNPFWGLPRSGRHQGGELDGGSDLGRGGGSGSSQQLGKQRREGPERCGWSLGWWPPFYRGQGGLEWLGDGSTPVPLWLLKASVTGVGWGGDRADPFRVEEGAQAGRWRVMWVEVEQPGGHAVMVAHESQWLRWRWKMKQRGAAVMVGMEEGGDHGVG
jgi:hypothetical protein